MAKLDLPSGRLSDGFRPSVKSRVDALAVHGSRLFFAGEITTVNGVKRWGLAAVDVNNGALEPGLAVKFSEPGNGVLTVNRLAIRPDGSRLVAMGSFLKADGKDRPRLAVLDLDGGNARLADWHTDGYADPCSSTFGPTYIRGVDISADGSFFVVVTTGGKARALCDSVARFELGGTGHDIKPTWVDASGGDSFIGLAVTDAAVYVGGHQRWMNNPYPKGTGKDAAPGHRVRPPARHLGARPGQRPSAVVEPWPRTAEASASSPSWPHRKACGSASTPTTSAASTTPDSPSSRPRAARSSNGLAPVVSRASSTGRCPAAAPGWRPRPWTSTAPERPPRRAAASTGPKPAPPSPPTAASTPCGPTAGSTPAGSRPTAPSARRIRLDLGGLDKLTKAKFPMRSLSGAAFDAERGRLYYTIAGDKRLFYRYFTPESGVIGGLPFVASGDGDKLDWKKVRGLMIADGYLYYANSSGDDLFRIEFRDGRPVPGTSHKVEKHV